MGRGGGGGGGGRGGGGGGRSSGSFGGGGRSSGGRGGGGGRGGMSSGSRGYSTHRTNYRSTRSYGYYPQAVVPNILVILLAALLVGGITFSLIWTGLFPDITKSTVQREPLAPGSTTKISEWFLDERGWLGTGREAVKGMENFEKKTGIQPFTIVTNNLYGMTMQEYAEDAYTRYYGDDGGHALFVWYEGGSLSDGDGKWDIYLAVGPNARSVLDTEATDIVLDYFGQLYVQDCTEDQLIGKMWTNAGNRIMTVTKPVHLYIVLAVVVVIGIVVAFVIWTRVRNRKDKEREEAAKILNTPLEHLDPNDVLGDE